MESKPLHCTLTDSELSLKAQTGPGWVKASEFNKKQNKHYCGRTKSEAGDYIYATIYWNTKGERFVNFSIEGGVEFEILDESAAGISQDAHEKEIMMQAFDKVRQIFVGRQWIMEGRGSYPYNDDRYQQEVRYMYDEFNQVVKDTWANIKSKSVDYRKAIIAEYLESAAGREDADVLALMEWLKTSKNNKRRSDMKLKDYLHYYMGATYWTDNSQGEVNKVTLQHIYPMIEKGKNVQLHLRRLEDMTRDEMKPIWQLITGRSFPDSGNIIWFDKEERTSAKRFVMMSGVDRVGIEMTGYVWADCDLSHIKFNPNHVVHYLLQQSFDLFGLIDAGLAIDLKTLNP